MHAAELVKTEIPPCPVVLTALLREMRADDPDFGRIAVLISRDIALASTAVQTVNSAAFNLPCPVATIREALTYLGLDAITRLIRGLLLRQAFPFVSGAAITQFWDDSAAIARITARVAGALRAVDPNLAYTFGLFRDCGMPVMLSRHADYTQIMEQTAVNSAPTLVAEQARYRTDHAALGLLLARQWHLPEALCNAIRYHHDGDANHGTRGDIDPASMKLIACATIADHLRAVSRNLMHRQASSELGLACAQLGQVPEQLAALAIDTT